MEKNKKIMASVILPVINETFSLQKTADIIMEENKGQIKEILIVIAEKTAPASLETADKIKKQYPNFVKIHKQHLPFLGGALQEAFEIAKGSHIILMSSDLETDPHTVKKLIDKAKEGYDIVACTRWHKESHFNGYHPTKLILNKIFQLFFRLLYWTNLTDLTFAFRIYKSEILKKIKWEELRHPFLLECLIKPLRLGYKTVEIPSSWEARKEGQSQNTFWRNFSYFYIGLKVFFMSKERIIKT